jgi:hypothetical protein
VTTPNPVQDRETAFPSNRHQRQRDEAIRRGGEWAFHGNLRDPFTPAIQHFHPTDHRTALCGVWFNRIARRPRLDSRVPRCQKCAAVVARATVGSATHDAHAAGIHARWGAGPGCPECKATR